MKRIVALVLLLFSMPLLHASCGGNEPSDEDQINDVISQIQDAESKEELTAVCTDLISRQFRKEVYLGKVETCVKEPLNSDEGIKDLGDTHAESMTVTGSNAKAKIVTVGGDNDGNDGTWSFVKTGDDWQLDRLEDDFLRSEFRVALENIDEGLFVEGPLRKCMINGVDDIDPKNLRKFIYYSARGDKKNALFLGNRIAFKACPVQLSGYVADILADQVIAAKGASAPVVECSRKALRGLLLTTGLTTQVLKGGNEFGSATAPALAGLIAGATQSCNK